MASEIEELNGRLASLIPEELPEDEATRLELQNRMMEISDDLNEIAAAVEELTRALMESLAEAEGEIGDDTAPEME